MARVSETEESSITRIPQVMDQQYRLRREVGPVGSTDRDTAHCLVGIDQGRQILRTDLPGVAAVAGDPGHHDNRAPVAVGWRGRDRPRSRAESAHAHSACIRSRVPDDPRAVERNGHTLAGLVIDYLA